ncbi:tRNA (adenosine(37)-N6)-dimethylallyltransferase MiaA [Lamprobacter modestohalophilus]|uniref:tRNA (adenosine(37)-N6)-dimethylallyltransferase MiaA n=1 Tax=Lamprobacter modestohalophilus TaxID=1064514 RepID=UPI002ADEBFF6|nr:tRNA (adenosine(37)-N6)-dimethylallyltransferase MiaA [Lamprobacter modestohalophilus]MEA1049761.1 tRNA (adenosine(37)-N6)-dimethylallyltransferase MiaA [Lamprobacter modestohalophilus]
MTAPDSTGGAGETAPPAILITGPTASGKTELALALAAQLPCELISVDSALVYRGMDIGTAKPAPSVLARFPHRLVDICDPSEAYSAARFRVDALAAMAEITAAGRIPLLVGGTMLYWRALVGGLSPLPTAQPEVRAQLAERYAAEGAAAMHDWLVEVDPLTAARVHQNDPQRVQRALEVFLVTGRPMSELWHRDAGSALPYRVLRLVRSPRERATLHQRIELRLQAMLAAGFEDEVRALYERGDLDATLPSMRAVGYRQLWAYLSGELSWEQMREKALVATRQLAKRQYTWLRAEENAVWLWDEAEAEAEIKQAALQQVEVFLSPAEPR